MSSDKQFIKDEKKPSTSLPLFLDTRRNELCTLGLEPGMECVPLRSPAEPSYHYHHVADQTKSLQELQNEVGALLEFRDLVIETFPDLKSKMASSQANSTLTGMPSSSLASRREWEPGIRVRRKLTQKENSEIVASSSLIRSRSNSHSNKKEPKSGGEGNNGSVVQDSGFSTETNSSKETHSSHIGCKNGNAALATPSSSNNNSNNRLLAIDTEDELWNLLDVIHRKSNRLRDEVEQLQNLEREKCRHNNNSNNNSNSNNSNSNDTSSYSNSNLIKTKFQNQLDHVNKEDVQILRKERDRLLDKLSEYEAEALSSRIRASKMQDEVGVVNAAKKDLEDQLRAALSQKLELNCRIHDLQLQHVNNANKTAPGSPLAPGVRKLSNDFSAPVIFPSPTHHVVSTNQLLKSRLNQSSFTPVIVKQQTQQLKTPFDDDESLTLAPSSSEVDAAKFTLGRLDGLVSSPNRTNKIRVADSKKIAAILLETNIIELQRHLLTITVQNQVLQQRLEQATRSRIFLNKKLEKSKEEIDDLKFQLEERTIELEGTKAQLRVVESKHNSKTGFTPEHIAHIHSVDNLLDSPTKETAIMLRLHSTPISTPSMKAMVPLAMDELLQHSSSTESAQDHTERDRMCPETPKRRPSKIPLPGSKGYVAPKPPSGRNFVASQKSNGSYSGPPSNRSLNKSTGSLYIKSTDPSLTHLVNNNNNNNNNNQNSGKKDSLNRPESAMSWRKEMSLEKSRSSSSIPISTALAIATKTSPSIVKPIVISSSPQPKSKRDSLTTRVKNLDSLSRMQSSVSNSSLNKLPSSSSSSVQSARKQSAINIRRVSSSNTRTSTSDQAHHQINEANGEHGKVRNIRASFWNWLTKN